MNRIFVMLILICGCKPYEQSEMERYIQEDYPDKVTFLKFYKTISDSDCDIEKDDNGSLENGSLDNGMLEEMKILSPFKVTRVQYRVLNKIGQNELHDRVYVIGKDGSFSFNANGNRPGKISKIVEKL